MSRYGVAQICINGHLIKSGVAPSPEKDFCKKCGAETITSCGACGAFIRGGLRHVRNGEEYVDALSRIPAFCEKCGQPYPWTESRIDAARDLADQLELDIPDRTLLEKSIEELIRDTPKAPAEAIRFKTIVGKAQPWVLGAFREILFSSISDAVRKLIWPV